MKKVTVIFRVILFISIFLLLNHWVMRAYVRFTRQPYEYEGTRRGFEAVKDEISFLVLGDSHPQHAVFTPMIPGSYNFASSGESYVLTYYKMRHYLKQDQLDLDVVVMPVSLHTFAGYRLERIGKQDPAFWAQYVDFIELGIESDKLDYFLLERIKAEFAYLGGLEEVAEIVYPTKPWQSNRMEDGFLKFYGLFSDREEEEIIAIANKRAAFHFEGVTYIDPLVAEYFNRLLDLLEEEDVQIVLVSFPSTPDYQNAAAQYFSVEDHLAEMEALIGDRENVLILDYHNLFSDRYDLFVNADHLNINGARVFTQILLADLEKNGITWDAETQP